MSTKIERLDSIAERITDILSPLTIKEVRQSLKGKLFLSSFLLGIVACLIPSIYFVSRASQAQGQDAFMTYCSIMFVGTSFVFPFLSFMSLHEDRLNSTFELIGITNLNAHQIVWGKWQSSMVQVSLFISSIIPFLTYSYFLKGISFFSILGIVIIAFFFAQFINLFAILAASLSHMKLNRLALYFVCVFVGAGFGSVSGGIGLAEEATRGAISEFIHYFSSVDTFFWVSIFVLTMAIAIEWFLYELASAQLSPATADRSSRCRYALTSMVLLFFVLSFVILFIRSPPVKGSYVYISSLDLFKGFFFVLFGVIFFLSIFIFSENNELSQVLHKKHLNSSGFFSRIYKTFYMPGRSSGYIFLISILIAFQSLLYFTNIKIYEEWNNSHSAVYYFFNAIFLVSFIYTVSVLPHNGRLTVTLRRVVTFVVMVAFISLPLIVLVFDENLGVVANCFNLIYYSAVVYEGSVSSDYVLVNTILGIGFFTFCCAHISSTKKKVQKVRIYGSGERGASQ